MFERFTDRARRVVVLAQEEARTLNHNYIGTEHILLGLIHEGDGIAAKVLTSFQVDLSTVRTEVEQLIGRGEAAPTGHIPFTPRAKKVLELSLRESMELGHRYIGTEHILLGLIREGEGVAAQVLRKLGADDRRLRQEVIQLLQGYAGRGDEGARTGTADPDLTARLVRAVLDESGTASQGHLDEWSRFLMEAAARGVRAKALASKLAVAFGDSSLDWLDVLVGLLVNDRRLWALERIGRQDLEQLQRRVAELRAQEPPDERFSQP